MNATGVAASSAGLGPGRACGPDAPTGWTAGCLAGAAPANSPRPTAARARKRSASMGPLRGAGRRANPDPGRKMAQVGRPLYRHGPPHATLFSPNMPVLLFDIDGTLVRTGGAGKLAMEAALCEEFGLALIAEEIPYSGRTDVAIGRDLLTAHGTEATPANRTKLTEGY